MTRTILITGSTDGIGLEAAILLAEAGHEVILHGRSGPKLDQVRSEHDVLGQSRAYTADLSDLGEVKRLAYALKSDFEAVDVLINNAGVFATKDIATDDGYDKRFVVNTIAPYLLTKQLLPLIPHDGRIINLSSAAQASITEAALIGQEVLGDGEAYAQSKLALTAWSRHMALSQPDGPAVIAVNPGSFLGTKMVRGAYGMEGKDAAIGAEILAKLATAEEFADAGGKYFDNDRAAFGRPHPDALDPEKGRRLVEIIEGIIANTLGKGNQ